MKIVSVLCRILVLAALMLGVPLAPAVAQELDISMDDIEDVVNTGADALAREMEQLDEGDYKEFKAVTDEDISGVAEGDIYKSNKSLFKVTSVSAKGDEGGVIVMERIRGKMDPSMKWNRMSGEGPLTLATRETMLTRIMNGGVVMYPIAFLLLLMLIVTLRSIFYYRASVHCPPAFVSRCNDAINSGDIAAFEELALKQKGLLAHTCRVMVSNIRRLTIDEIKSRAESAAIFEVGRLNFPLRLLNFIAVAAPLLGLLGTVIGMIACFDSLAGESATQSKAMAMAAGIKQALMTTAFGLVVALPALLIFFIFNHQLNQIASRCAVEAEEFIHGIAVLRRRTGTDIDADDDELETSH